VGGDAEFLQVAGGRLLDLALKGPFRVGVVPEETDFHARPFQNNCSILTQAPGAGHRRPRARWMGCGQLNSDRPDPWLYSGPRRVPTLQSCRGPPEAAAPSPSWSSFGNGRKSGLAELWSKRFPMPCGPNAAR